MPSLDYYLALIPPEHANKPKFVETVTLAVRPYVDCQQMLVALNGKFDVDVAVGQQLDYVGQWIGRTRYIQVPLNIYFSFDVAGLGADQGVWFGPFEATTGLTALPDPAYRILLKATIAANYWDGTGPGAANAWNTLLSPFGYNILVQDYDHMNMAIALIGIQPNVIVQALFTTGELDLKPAGVMLSHVLPSIYPAGNVNGIAGTPIFGLDADNGNIGGFDHGAWGLFISTE